MVKLIKLNITGEVGEVNISLKKNEKYNLNTIKSELQISKKSFKLQHEWEIENKKVLRLLVHPKKGKKKIFINYLQKLVTNFMVICMLLW